MPRIMINLAVIALMVCLFLMIRFLNNFLAHLTQVEAEFDRSSKIEHFKLVKNMREVLVPPFHCYLMEVAMSPYEENN